MALGGVTWVSSSGVIAKMLGDLGRLGNRETPAVLGVLVMEDLMMALYLPLLTALLAGGGTGSVLVAIVGRRRDARRGHRARHPVRQARDAAGRQPRTANRCCSACSA